MARTRRRRDQQGGRKHVPGRPERDGEVDNVLGTVDRGGEKKRDRARAIDVAS